jgi:aminopeptidase N
MKRRSIAALVILALIFSGCGLYGIHFHLKNPRKAGKYPKVTQKDKLRGELTKYRSCYDVKHYALNITVDNEKKYIKGYVNIHAEATAVFDTLQVDLYPGMKINSIEYKGQKLVYKRKEGAVFIGMPAAVSKGEKIMLRVDYEGMPRIAPKPPWNGGFVWKEDKNKRPWIGVACEGLGASLWWPCKDHLSDEPDSTAINITVKKGLMCVSNGRLRDSISAGDQTTYKWFVSYPINTYNITLYIGDLKLLHDTYTSKLTGKTLDLDHYVLPYNYEIAKTHFQQLKKHLDFYEKYFGEYPWHRDGFKFVESPYAGMEHQSAIAYGNGYKNGNDGFDYIVLHEAAHEWWGNSVTNLDYADIWIHEGFATHCEALYVEQDRGKQAYINYLLFQRWFIKNERPVVGPTGRNYFNYKDSDPYMKGTWILHTLRTTIDNDPLYFDILRSFYQQYKGKQVTSQDFIDLVNSKTGKDYTGFFKQYLYTRKVPVLEYYLDKEGNLAYRWKETDGSFTIPVQARIGNSSMIIYPAGEVKVSKIDIAGTDAEVTFSTEKALFIVKEVKRKKLKEARYSSY